MPTVRALPLALLAAALGCAGSQVNVQTEFDPKADPARYQTYAWIASPPGPEQAPAARNPLVRGWIVQAVERELAAKGLRKVELDASPSFLVAIHGYARSRIEVQQYGYTYGYGPYGFYPAPVGVMTDVREYKEGTLLVDFVDAGTKSLIWRGTATATLASQTPSQREVDVAVKEVLAAYPPPKQR
jgi:hypothetical protein